MRTVEEMDKEIATLRAKLASMPGPLWMLLDDHRAALIEELKTLAKKICPRCAAGKPYPHKRNSNPYAAAAALCHAADVNLRIEELEKAGE